MQIQDPSLALVDGRKIAYDEVGPANPKGTIILLTGLASKRLGWRQQMKTFGATYRTLALDLRDTGDSDAVDDFYTIADVADDIAAFLAVMDIPRAHIVGISMGGFIALEFALRHPAQLEKLVLVSTSGGGKTHTRPGLSMSLGLMMPNLVRREIGETAKRSYARIMAPSYCQTHPDEWEIIADIARYRPQARMSYRRQLRACLRHDVAARLGEIHAPTLVIHGERDPLVPVANGRYLAQHIPGARLILYPTCGHIPIVECADDFNRDVLAFLDSH